MRQAASTLTPPTAPNHDNINIVAHNIGGMTKTCHYCDAKLWPTETSSLCCANGQVNLPPLQTLPQPLHQLFVGDTAESRCFQNNSRSYNSAFAFASFGVNEGMLQAGVYCSRVSSTVCHRIDHLQPNTDGERPKFAQLYIYDSDNETQTDCSINIIMVSTIIFC